MSEPEPQRPRLKISISNNRIPAAADASTTPAPATTASLLTPGGQARKIVFKGAQPVTPVDTPRSKVATPSAKTKAGRQTKPTAKKREHDELGDDTITIETEPKPKKRVVKLVATKGGSKPAPNIVIRAQGRPPVRPPGEGYDSEASDREEDPTVEEQIVFRMIPGEHCNYIRQAIEENKFGPRREGGADIQLTWFDDDTRRAVLKVKGQLYAAVLVDLPTITEGMKTWDRKSLLKSSDICQMLLVFQAVASESEAKTVPLPKAVESGFKWPHGLTPPMHDCVHRRFAKVISRKEIEDKEAEVERLLRLDREARSSKWEVVDDRQAKTPAEMVEYEEDAEGDEDDVDYFQSQNGEFDATAAAELEADLEAAFEEAGSTTSPATQMEGVTPMTGNTTTPAAQIRETVEQSEESAEDDDDDDDDLDEEEQTRMDEVKGVRAIIADLQAQLKEKEESLKLPHVANSIILRRRVETTIRDLKSEIQLKMSSIGIEEEEEEEE
ncbi:hypothetical protein jhhlp_002323 [Lomentospora prolificans]|uniref:TAFII55 protein conserved region domain-containing protein n=1 Tax=Lomentospora prolificans TaxID=41688 RepID=A0A2N3NDR2_9PEZI|nr:hypothetical protein jhhlp_002323 [Lomentospora prolificans]